jgi:hypothetical protein
MKGIHEFVFGDRTRLSMASHPVARERVTTMADALNRVAPQRETSLPRLRQLIAYELKWRLTAIRKE